MFSATKRGLKKSTRTTKLTTYLDLLGAGETGKKGEEGIFVWGADRILC